jgi:dihydrofolate reductase
MKAIAAINNEGYIGKDGKLMWRSSEDFKHFKTLTKGGIMIIGKVTYEVDLGGKPLPGRIMVVVGSSVFPTLWDAVKGALIIQTAQQTMGIERDIWVIGGASIYNQLWPLINELHLSIIDDNQKGDRRLDIPADFRGQIHKYYFEPNKEGTN